MKGFLTKKNTVICSILLVFLFIFFSIVNPGSHRNNSDPVQIKHFEFEISSSSHRYDSIITVPFKLTNLKDENQELKPSETFKLFGDGKEIPMKEIWNTSDKINIMTVSPEAIMLMDMKFETNEEIEEYILQVRNKKLFKDKVYEYNITQDIKNFGK